MLLMPGSSNWQWMPIDCQSGTGSRRLHDLDAFGHDFAADIVAQQNPDLHDHSPRNSSPTAYAVQNNCSSHQWPPAIVSSAKVEYPAPTKAMWDFMGRPVGASRLPNRLLTAVQKNIRLMLETRPFDGEPHGW